MGRTKHCVYPKCRSDSRYAYKEHMFGVSFVPFPKPKRTKEASEKWLSWLKEVRPEFNVVKINSSTYLCSKHFVGSKGPSEAFPNPIHDHSLVSILKPASVVLKNVNTGTAKATPAVAHIRELEESETTIPVIENPMEVIGMNSNKTSLSTTVLYTTTEDISNVVASGSLMIAQLIQAVRNSENYSSSDNQLISKTVQDVSNTSEKTILDDDKTNAENIEVGNIEVENIKIENIKVENIEVENIKVEIPEDYNTDNNDLMTSLPFPDCFNMFFNSEEWRTLAELNWAMSITKSLVKFYKIDSLANAILISISINAELDIKLEILNKEFDNTFFKIPSKLYNIQDIKDVFASINKWKICCGNQESSMKTFIEETQSSKKIFFCWQTSAIHDSNCSRMTTNIRSGRCYFCTQLRRYILNGIRQSKQLKKKKIKTLSKEEIIERLKRSKAREKNLVKRVKRMKLKAKKVIEEHENVRSLSYYNRQTKIKKAVL